jgi:hypothetical protein
MQNKAPEVTLAFLGHQDLCHNAGEMFRQPAINDNADWLRLLAGSAIAPS